MAHEAASNMGISHLASNG